VSFPSDNLDVFDLCNDELKGVLTVARKKAADATWKGAPGGAATAAPAASSASTASASNGAPVGAGAGAGAAADDDLEAAIRLSLAATAGSGGGSNAASSAPASSSGRPLLGPGIPEDFRGMYELYAIVTHKGRDSSSGHYMGWVRRSAKEWLIFDDDAVTTTDTETVTSRLKGGGDEHMAYLLFYRAVQ
jgi:ubiquitin carboxyl-terminal hydrolase 14